MLRPLLLLAALLGGLAAQEPPNVILVVTDDLGWGDLGCYGQRTLKTPVLDRMAREGRRFTDFYAGSTVCAPSRCVLMTGQHTGHCLIRGNGKQNLRPEDVTLAEVLKPASYATGLFGKWGIGHEGSDGLPTRQGFDRFYGYLDQHHAHNYYPTFLVRGEKRVALKNVVEKEGRWGQGVASKKVEYSHDLITKEALRFIDDHRARRFFLCVTWTLPHANNEAGRRGMEIPDLGPFAKESWPEPAKGFAAMVARIDRDMGRLLDRLRKHGIDENTLVLFTSDNGPHSEGGHKSKTFNSSGPLKGQKRSLHEGGIRVPMIARWPGRIPAGTTSAQVAGFQDLLPTFARIGGATANVPRDIDGVSIASSLLEATPKIVPRSLYWAFYEGRGGQAVRNGRWKAVQQPYHTKVRLYDLKDDIGEQHDLAAKRPKLVAKLSEIMKQSYAPSDRWKFKPRRR